MDMPVNVPVDNPNADTEWYVSVLGLNLEGTDTVQERHTPQTWGHT